MTFPGIITRLSVLKPAECSHIINTCKPFVEPSEVGKSDNSYLVDTATRSSKSVIIGPEDNRFTTIRPLLQKTVESFVECTNTAFHQNIQHIEAIQFTEYTEGDFYNWHMDSSPGTPRITSASLCLSDFRSFTGGDLSFRDMVDPETEGDEPLSVKIQQGELAVFPSLLVHSVKPITQGTRYSLVLWSPFVDVSIDKTRTDLSQSQKDEKPVMAQGQDPIVF